MKAAQIVAPRRFAIVEVEPPAIDGETDGSVLIKTARSALCGSDMPFFSLERPASHYPLPAGQSLHECIGVVAASRSRRFREGDPVLSIPEQRNGLAEYFLAREEATVALPAHENADHILMAQPLGTVICACRRLGNLLGRDTVVVGQGPMGLLFARVLSNLGARTVIVTDLVDYRLAVSRQMLATHTINAAREDPVAAVAEITGGAMADVVVEAVGHQSETLNHCLDLVKRGGTVLAFGVPDERLYTLRFGDLFRRNVQLIGAVGQEVQRDVPLAMDMITQGRVDVSPIITHHLPFTEAQRAFELALGRREGAVKIVLEYA